MLFLQDVSLERSSLGSCWQPFYDSKKQSLGAGPMAKRLSLRALLQWPRVSPVRILGADMAPLVKPCWMASHMPQLEGPTTKSTQLCTGGLWGEKGKIKS